MPADLQHNQPETIRSAPLFSRDNIPSLAWFAVLLFVLSLQIWFPRIISEVNDSYNVDSGGRNALFQFIENAVAKVERNHHSLPEELSQRPPGMLLCILGPARYPSDREWTAIRDWVSRGGVLLFAARWDDPEMIIPDTPLRVTPIAKKEKKSLMMRGEKDAKTDQVESTPKTAATPPSATIPADLRFSWFSNGRIDTSAAETLVSTAAGPQAVMMKYGRGSMILAASDYIFSNTALFADDERNGELAARLFDAAGNQQSILFDESLNETGTPRVVGLLIDPVLRPSIVQLAVLIVLFGWCGNRRFGAVLPSSTVARHDVAEHTNSLGNLYYKAHHGSGLLREYLDQLKTDLRLRFAGKIDPRVLQPIAARTGLTVEEIQSRLKAAETAARAPKLSRRDAAMHIRRLAQLRQVVHKRTDSTGRR